MRATRPPRFLCVIAAAGLLAGPQDPAAPAHELVYRFAIERAIARGELDEKVDLDAVMERTVVLLRSRLADCAAGLEVSRRDDRDVVVEIPPRAAAALPAIRHRIETPPPRLEMRLVASAGPSAENAAFDLSEEKRRLQSWLRKDHNRAKVESEPQHIDVFNALSAAAGGPLAADLRWCPGKIFPNPRLSTRWSYSYASEPDSVVVPLFTVEQLRKEPPREPGERPFLIELFPIDMREASFDGGDLEPSKMRVVESPETGLPCVQWEIADARRAEYAAFAGRHIHDRCAIIIDGIVRAASALATSRGGDGIIWSTFTEQEAVDLVRGLALERLPVPPELVSQR